MRIGKKCDDLVIRSTMTQIASDPFRDFGSPRTKSMVIISHFHYGTGKGCNNPPGRLCSAFTCWHVKHLETKSATSRFNPDHQNWRAMS